MQLSRWKNGVVDSQNNKPQTRPHLNTNALTLQRAIIGLRPTILLKLLTRITIVIAIVIIITIEIRRAPNSSKTPRHRKQQPKYQITAYIRARMYGSVPEQQGGYVGGVPDHGETKRDEYPGEENEVAAVEVEGVGVGVGVVVVVVV